MRFHSNERILFAVFCCWIFIVFPVQADTDTRDLFPKYRVLSPLRIDDKYLGNEIPAEEPKGTLTLHGAVQEAAMHNRDILKASLEVSRSKWDYIAQETKRLPDVRLIGYLAQQTINTELIPDRADAFFFASALFPVTQHYRLGLEAHAIKLGREIAEQKLRQQIDETASRVKAAYYKLALDISLLDDIQDSIKSLTELQRVVDDQVKRGNSLRVEQMQVAARLAKSELDETKARNTYNIDCEKFNHLLGHELRASVKLELIPAVSDLELDNAQAENRALAMRPEIRQADARVRQINLEKKVIMSEYIPNISIGALYISLPGFNNTVLPKNVLAPGFFINYNAFDWGRKAMLAKARTKVEQGASLSAQNVRDEVLIDLHTQINKLNESRQMVQTSKLARAASREELRVTMNRYKYTSAKLSEVLQSQSSLADANNSYHQALLAFWEAKAEFDRAVGAEP